MTGGSGVFAQSHKWLVGSGLVALVLLALGSIADFFAFLDANWSERLWALAGLVALIAIGALVDAFPTSLTAAKRWQLVAGATSLAISGVLAGWGFAIMPEGRGNADIFEPRAGAEVETCSVDIRFEGRPAAGKAFVVASKQDKSEFYFEADVQPEGADEWLANIQAGVRDLTEDERYTISVYELDRAWLGYLMTVMRATEDRATYWSTRTLPPELGSPLATVGIEQISNDPTCEA